MTTDHTDDDHHGERPKNVPMIIASIAILLLLASLDQTIVSTALPTIVSDLGGLEHLSWVVTAYILSSTVVAPLYGKIGDLYGRRNTVAVSVGIFLLGSALCGISQDMTQLILSRALQGLGGGGLFVLTLSVIGDVIPPQDRGKVQGVFAAVFSISSVVGPLLGGWFVDQFSWHWIFFINIPLGLLAAWTFWISFHPKMHRVSHKIDWMGAVTLSVALASLTLVTTFGGRDFEWLSAEIIGLAAIAAIFAVAFVMVELRASEPIVPLELFKLNVFWVTSIIGFISGAAMFGAITFLPLYLQISKGVSPTESGLMLIPMTFGILFSSTIAGQTMSRLGKYYYLPIAGMISLIFGMYLLTNLEPDTSTLTFSLYIMTVGFGMGFIFPVVTTAVQNAVPKKQLGAATASGLLFRQVGGSLGVAVFGALFTARMTEQFAGAPGGMGENISSFGPQMVAGLPEPVREMVAQGVVNALHPIYWMAMAMAVVGLGFAFILKEVPLTNRHVPKGD